MGLVPFDPPFTACLLSILACCLDLESSFDIRASCQSEVCVLQRDTLLLLPNVVLVFLMSDPARLLQSLNLNDMPVTRSQSQIPQQRGSRTPRGGGRRRGRGRAQIQVGPIRSHSGMRYDTQMLSPTSSRRAAEGLQSEFIVDRLEGFNTGRDRYYAFQLSKPVTVRIHDPAIGADRFLECTCVEFQTPLQPCAHIWVRYCERQYDPQDHAYWYSGYLTSFTQCARTPNKELLHGDPPRYN